MPQRKPKNDPPPKDDNDNDDDDLDDNDDDLVIDPEELRGAVRDVLTDLLPAELLNGKGKGKAKDDDGNDDDDDKGKPKGRGTVRDVEDGIEDQVRRAVERVNDEKDTKTRIAKIEKAIEQPPKQKARRLTRLLWGDDE